MGSSAMSRQLIGCILWAVVGLVQSASAQENPIKITLRREWEGARTSAPLSLRAFLKWQKPELLEGRLQVSAFIDSRKFSSWISPETALSDSEQVIWFMTPRPVLEDKMDRYVLEAEFLGVQRSFEPEQLDVDVPLRSKRVMVVGIVVDNRATTPTGLGSEESPIAFERPLSLQNFLSKDEIPELFVNLSRVSPIDLPADSLRLLGLDAILLPHDMLDRLRTAQLDALRVWILAGGSLAVIQTGSLRSEATEFISSLSRNEWTSESKSLRQIPTSVQVYSPGLGQVVIATQRLAGDSAEWERTAHLLMRIQPDRASDIERNNQLRLRDTLPGSGIPTLTRSELEGATALEPRPRFDFQDLSRMLIPSSIRGMPFWLAASVLASCLICVGPGDYFLLGFLRRRKWTWVLFPVVALGFTGWMAHLAAEHNGRNDSRNWMSVVDVTPENEVVRTSRLEQTYGASGRTVAHAVKNQWWIDVREEDLLRLREMKGDDYWVNQRQANNNLPTKRLSQELGERLSYQGNVPGHYMVEESVRQWAPRMQRITTLGADPGLADYPLPQLKWETLIAGEPSAITDLLKQRLPSDWKTASWKMSSPTKQTDWNHLTGNDSISARTTDVLKTISQLVWETRSPAEVPGRPGRASGSIFTLLTELSPTAAPDCEDLVITSRPTLVLVKEVESGRYLALRIVFAPEAQ